MFIWEDKVAGKTKRPPVNAYFPAAVADIVHLTPLSSFQNLATESGWQRRATTRHYTSGPWQSQTMSHHQTNLWMKWNWNSTALSLQRTAMTTSAAERTKREKETKDCTPYYWQDSRVGKIKLPAPYKPVSSQCAKRAFPLRQHWQMQKNQRPYTPKHTPLSFAKTSRAFAANTDAQTVYGDAISAIHGTATSPSDEHKE